MSVIYQNFFRSLCGEWSAVWTVFRTTRFGGGFVKEDVLSYLSELNSKIEYLEMELKRADIPIPESCKFGSEVGVLRTTRIGKGFVKEDVLTYLDALNSKIRRLETEIEKIERKKSDFTEFEKEAKIKTDRLLWFVV